jgi:hypothetical protein
MTKHELRLLAQSKEVGFKNIGKSLFFLFPGEERAIPVTAASIQRVVELPVPVSPEAEVPVNAIYAISLKGLSQEERDAKVLELIGAPKPNDLPGLDNYPIVEEQ